MRQFTWTAPNGDQLPLNDPWAGYRLQRPGTRGLDSPEYEMVESQYAHIDGAALDALAVPARTVSLGMLVEGDTPEQLRARWRALVRAFRPKAGDGVLRVATPDGRARSLTCRYAGGLEGDGDAETAGGRMARAVIRLRAFDPWFYGEPTTFSVGLGDPVPFFPIPPVSLSPSTVQGEFTVDLSDTDSLTPVVWTIRGPGTSLDLTNHTTGDSIVVNAPFPDGEIAVIDTRPGHQSVRRGDGTNLMPYLASDPALWQLVDDVNEITADLAGATGESRITGAYAPRYAGI